MDISTKSSTHLKRSASNNFSFVKYQAAGNDFVLIEDFDQSFPVHAHAQIATICHRKFGIGADGLLLIQRSRVADCKMRIFNADGYEARMCGNGLKCIIKHMKRELSIETKSGIALGQLTKEGVRATLPISDIILSPMLLDYDLVGHLTDTGTEHLVIFIDDLDKLDFDHLGPHFRHHKSFTPRGVNVNFATITPTHIRVRTFEKGVEAETLSCGTGGGAVALIAQKTLRLPGPTNILYASGERAQFHFDPKGHLWMTGDASATFSGNFIS